MLETLNLWVQGVPPWVVYLALGAGAAVENVIPAVPADTFVLLGGFLTALHPTLDPWWVFVSTWLLNAASALAMYRLGFTHGRGFFTHGWGAKLLNAHQMRRMARFYGRFGTPAIFFTRFLPGLRSIVPIFAGVTHQGFWKVAPPIILASAVWYGALVWVGSLAGRNLPAVRAAMSDVNGVLLALAALGAAAAFLWWWRTRHLELPDHEHPSVREGDEPSSGA